MMGGIVYPPPISKPPKPMKFNRDCGNCIWWVEIHTSDKAREGTCRKNTPTAFCGFPHTWAGIDWCGEFLREES